MKLTLLVLLGVLLFSCLTNDIAVTPTTETDVKMDCPGILNDTIVCRRCEIEDATGITPENCELIEIPAE